MFRSDIERFEIYKQVAPDRRKAVWFKAQMQAISSWYGAAAVVAFACILYAGLAAFESFGLEGSIAWAVIPALIAGYVGGELLARGACRELKRMIDRGEQN